MDYVKNRFIREESQGVALDKHMMHVTISYPLPDNRLFNAIVHRLEEGSVNVDMISQIVNIEGLRYHSLLKIVMYNKFQLF